MVDRGGMRPDRDASLGRQGAWRVEFPLREHLAPWRNFTMTANFLLASFNAVSPYHRSWFCVRNGSLWTTPWCGCKEDRGCGYCASDATRSEAAHRLVMDILHAIGKDRHGMAVCIIMGCRDGPSLLRTAKSSFYSPRQSESRQRQPLLVVSYTSAPVAWDVPFPDYSTWREWAKPQSAVPSYPRWLEQLQSKPSPTWESKRDAAPFGCKCDGK